jgi:hypothetical protein
LEVDKEVITDGETCGKSNTKSTKPWYCAKKPHFFLSKQTDLKYLFHESNLNQRVCKDN